MIEIQEDDITSPQRTARSNSDGDYFRFTLTKDKRKGYYMDLSAPKEELSKKLTPTFEGEQGQPYLPDHIRVSSLSEEKSLSYGLEGKKHILIRLGTPADPGKKLRPRGNKSVSVRVGTYELEPEVQKLLQDNYMLKPLQLHDARVGSFPAVVITLPTELG